MNERQVFLLGIALLHRCVRIECFECPAAFAAGVGQPLSSSQVRLGGHNRIC